MKLLSVLLIEDDDRDAILTLRAFQKQPIVVLERVETGEEALLRLRAGRHPDLVLLDLSLPGMDGHGVLTEAKNDPQLRRIPFVALTSSRSDEDVLRSWDLHVAGYLHKPIDMAAFRALAAHVVKWWSVNELPPKL